ncbi:pyruvate kinase [Clostridium formicaceticum]|uniref:Pyruvate kinase n=1 Tax=Clostridium formicaceticum TaxID=1497 RepID=A0AAC9RN93_9CLOT|nr:pyruvate kinase [Clostridium formicaceticum]AOY74753.1 pyruvate kinase [Clostridium formicaceticum]ARE89141.1 Pyruvate kinase [Clostridium formicaceticum]
MKKTKIVCTLGPASEEKEVFKQLVENGLNVARLNFSHGTHEEHGKRIETVKEVREELNLPVAILLDTKGPEIRTGKFEDPEVYLQEGQTFTLTTREVLGNAIICSISYSGLAKDVKAGDSILIDDGLIGLRVQKIIDETDIECIVENAGVVKNHKGVNVPGVKINLPAITDKDKADIEFGIKMDIDFIAASFVRKPEDVLAIRKILEENNAEHIQIISKIENQEGVDNLDAIIEVSDGIMVARGDLGVEIPTEEIPLVQKNMIEKCNKVAKPVITATQMLDSMIRNPRPTRAEVTDVANAILDGTDAIMLSGETAAGKYPIEAVKTMTSIAKRIETSIDYRTLLRNKAIERETTITDAISNATCVTAMDLQASAIVTATSSGHTARMVSKFRPKAPIIATTTKERVRRRLSLVWGVNSILIEEMGSTDDIFHAAIQSALQQGMIQRGELVVITAGVPVGVAGTTNLIKAHIVGDILLNGTGIGKGAATGKVVVVDATQESEVNIEAGDILVTQFTDKDLIPYMEIAGAIVTEEGGLTSHGAIVGLNLGKPTVVGANHATNKLKDGDIVTVDAKTGLIYSGKTRVL